jgi:hypothetical protein
MKGILVHSTTRGNIEPILINEALYDSSKTEPEFGEGEDYTEIISNKIFFQLVFEPIMVTGNYQLDKGFQNDWILLFDSSMMEEYGHKKYTQSESDKHNFKHTKNKERFLENEIPKTKVWFNLNWWHGVFHKLNRKKEEYSFNYNPETKLEDNIQEFYDAKVRYIQRTAPKEDLNEYEEMTEKEKMYMIENFKPEMPKTFTYKVKNEVVFQTRKISLKPTKKAKHLLAVYCYDTSKNYIERLGVKYPEYTFLKSPEELQEFMKTYYK